LKTALECKNQALIQEIAQFIHYYEISL